MAETSHGKRSGAVSHRKHADMVQIDQDHSRPALVDHEGMEIDARTVPPRPSDRETICPVHVPTLDADGRRMVHRSPAEAGSHFATGCDPVLDSE